MSIAAPHIEFDDQACLWKPKALKGISLFKAQFKRFAFSKHTHDGFAIGVIEQGAQQFFHFKKAFGVTPGQFQQMFNV